MSAPRFASLLLLAAALAACDRDPNVDPGPEYPPRGEIVSGDLQQDTVGDRLPQAIAVRVTDQEGEPIAGQTVSFVVTAGGGSLFAATAQTSADGVASNQWTLGTVAGDTQRVEARMIDPESGQPVVLATFRAVGVPDAPAAITPLPPVSRTGGAGQTLADSLRARVTDQFGNPVPGVPVVWSATGGGTVSPATGTTSALGIASAAWTLGTTVGAQQTAAASLSPAVRAEFTAVASVPMGAVLVKVAGDGQTVTVGSSIPLTVELRTATGQPLANVGVHFTPALNSGAFAAPGFDLTDAGGQASSSWGVGSTPGTRQLTVSVDGVAPVTFTATVTADAPVAITALPPVARTGGAGQVLADSLRAQVTDRFGNPVPGATVVWSAAGGGSVSPATAATDAQGIAEAAWTLGTAVGTQQTAFASLSPAVRAQFTAVASVPMGAVLTRVAGNAQTGTVGEALGTGLTVELRTGNGQRISGANVFWTPASGSGAASPGSGPTDGDGQASTVWTLGTVPGPQQLTASVDGATPVVFTATASPGAPDTLVKIAGDGQAAPPNAPLPQALTVAVRDRFGNALQGVTVTWAAAGGGGSLTPTQSQTNEIGQTSAQWTLGPTVGPQAAAASMPGAPPATFTAGAVVGPVDRIVVAPDSMHFTSVTATAQLQAQAVDAYGNPVAGVTFTWGTLDPGVATVSGSGSTATVTSTGNGATRIRAFGAGKIGEAEVTVQQVPATITLTSLRTTLVEYDSVTVTATARDARNQPMPTPALTWSSSNPAAATVTQAGGVIAVGAGTPTITATASNGVSGSRAFTTRAALQADTLATGAFHSCAVAPSGTAYCWGSNLTRQIAFTGSNNSPPRAIPGLAFVSITTSEADRGREYYQGHTCGVEADGDAYCWGNTESGQLGYAEPRDENGTGHSFCGFSEFIFLCEETPTQVAGGGWVQLDAGANHTCGITTSGTAYCWGRSTSGQLGSTAAMDTCYDFFGGIAPPGSPFPCAMTPRLVEGGLTFEQISAGDDFTCGLTTAGLAYCWGRNDVGQLGDGSTTQRNTPVPVSGGSTFARISAGVNHVCGVTTANGLLCWGSNATGKLGIGSFTGISAVPVSVAGSYRVVSAGSAHTCAVTAAFRLACWGENDDAQLGLGDRTNRATPTLIPTDRLFRDVGAGFVSSCAMLATDGAIFCWGGTPANETGGSTGPNRGAVPAP